MARDTRFHLPPTAAPQPSDPRELQRLEFGRKLYALMLDKGWNQSDLAREADMGRDSVSNYVRGRTLPDPKSAQKLCEALGVEMGDLYPGALQRATAADWPQFEIKQAPGRAGRAWLRINKEVSFATAAKIAELITTDEEQSK